MSLEAVPCVLKQADGTPVYGLLIRPSCTPRTIILQSPPPPPPPKLIQSDQSSPTNSDSQFGSHRVPYGFADGTDIEAAKSALDSKQLNSQQPAEMGMTVLAQKGHPVESKGTPSSGQVFIPASAVHHYQNNRLPVPNDDGVPPEKSDSQLVPQLPSSTIQSSSEIYRPAPEHHCGQSGEGKGPNLRLPPLQGLSAEPSAMELAELLDDMNTQDLAKILAESESLLAPGEGLEGLIPAGPYSTTQLPGLTEPLTSLPQEEASISPVNNGTESLEPLRPACRFQTSGMSHALFNPTCVPDSTVPQFVPSPEVPGAPRPQLEWERGPIESSGTPDSGIQSIAGSPSNAETGQQLSPPMLPSGESIRIAQGDTSPPVCSERSVPNYDQNQDLMRTTDYSDMPKLVPEGIQNIDFEESSSPPSIDQSLECPQDISSDPIPEQPNPSCGPTGSLSNFSLTSTDPKQLVDGLLSALEPQKLLQFSEYFEAKLKGTAASIQDQSQSRSKTKALEQENKVAPSSPLCPRTGTDGYYSDVSSCSKSDNRPSSCASQTILTDNSDSRIASGASQKLKLARLRDLRKRIKRIAPPKLNCELEDLLDQMQRFSPHQIQRDRRAKLFKMNWDAIKVPEAEEVKTQNLSDTTVSPNLGNIELEADSDEDLSGKPSDQRAVSISDNPEEKSISLKITLSRLKERAAGPLISNRTLMESKRPELSLPPKKRIRSVVDVLSQPQQSNTGETVLATENTEKVDSDQKGKKKRAKRRAPYPWDRKRKSKSSAKNPVIVQNSTESSSETISIPVSKPLIRKCLKCRCWVRSSLVPDSSLCSSCASNSVSSDRSLKAPEKKPIDSTCAVTDADSVPLAKKYCQAGILSDSKGIEGPPALRLPANIASSSGCFDFRIPFDIWHEFRESKPSRRKPPSHGFKEIKKNVYLDVPSRESSEPPICRCTKPTPSPLASGCDGECLNRITFVECSTDSCPCQDMCSNRRLQSGSWVDTVQVKDTGSQRGRGLFLLKNVSQGALVGEYIGEVISADRFMNRIQEDYRLFTHHYALNLDGGFVIDSYRRGSIMRFSNHSCEPNCEMQKWWVDGLPRMGLFTLRDLKAGEELTYNYNFHSFSARQACFCGTEKCRGYIGDKANGSKKDSSPSQLTFRPLTFRERETVRRTQVFLVRNYERTRKETLRESPTKIHEKSLLTQHVMAQLTALRISRSAGSRKRKEEIQDKNFNRTARLVQVFMQLYGSVADYLSSHDLSVTTAHGSLNNHSTGNRLAEMKEEIMSGKFSSPLQFNAAVLTLIEEAGRTSGPEAAKLARRNFEKAKQSVCGELSRELLFELEGFIGKNGDEDETARKDLLTSTADVGYVDKGLSPVGTYDPDRSSEEWSEKADEGDGMDRVRCPCGVVEDEGVMMQCDQCLYWEHEDCVGPSTSDPHMCYFCTHNLKRVPKANVVQIPQPDIRLPCCLYYRCLVAPGGVQVRLGECCYVKKLIGEAHKVALKRFHQDCVEPMKSGKGSSKEKESKLGPSVTLVPFGGSPSKFTRSDLRVFRIERLFTSPNGDAFVFGFYYARPHETFCEPTRRFYKTELFCTPLYDTLPLEAVVGRCIVMDPQIYFKGRPLYPKFEEGDVYVCEFKVDRSQRFFEKLSNRNRYPINTLPYVFTTFKERLKIKRNFTPFQLEPSCEERCTGSKGVEEMTLAFIKEQLLYQKAKAKRQHLSCVTEKVFPSSRQNEDG